MAESLLFINGRDRALPLGAPFGAKRGLRPLLLEICNATIKCDRNVREMYLCWLCYLLIFHYDHILPDVVIE